MNIEHLLPLIIRLKQKMATLESQQLDFHKSLRQAAYVQDNSGQVPLEDHKIDSPTKLPEEEKHILKSSPRKNDSL